MENTHPKELKLCSEKASGERYTERSWDPVDVFNFFDRMDNDGIIVLLSRRIGSRPFPSNKTAAGQMAQDPGLELLKRLEGSLTQLLSAVTIDRESTGDVQAPSGHQNKRLDQGTTGTRWLGQSFFGPLVGIPSDAGHSCSGYTTANQGVCQHCERSGATSYEFGVREA